MGIREITILVCLVAFTYTQTPPCTSFLDHFLPHPFDCNRYISCFAGRPFDLTCDINGVLEHDRCNDRCRKRDETPVNCQCSSCPQNLNGRFRSMTRNNCSEYDMCTQGQKLFTRTCPSGQLFDPTKGDCLDAASVKGCEIDTCLMTPNTKAVSFAPDAKDCKKFFTCVERKEVKHDSCPPGSMYDVNNVRTVADVTFRGNCVLQNTPNATCYDGMNWCFDPKDPKPDECHVIDNPPLLFT